MLLTLRSDATPANVPSLARPTLAGLLPREHGSWALALEPMILALVAEPSLRGASMAMAALGLFLMRRPWQVALINGDTARRAQARRVLGVLATIVVVTGAVGVAESGAGTVGPLVVAALAGAAFAWFDHRRAARGAVAELAGAGCYAALAVVVVACSETPVLSRTALVVGGFAWARSLTSILPVRAYVRRRKGQSVSTLAPLLVAGACAGAGLVIAPSVGTWSPAFWLVIFFIRSAWLVGAWAPMWPARRIGILELVLGIAAMVSVGVTL